MSGYRESASADGAWTASFYPGNLPSMREARGVLANACTDDMPVAAAVHNINGYAAKITIFRDPSTTHGAPGPEACEKFAQALSWTQGWAPGRSYLLDLLVMLGLREGYDPSAPVHPAPQIEHCLSNPVELVSARRVDGVLRTYREPGVVLNTTPEHLPAVTAVAGELRQERFIVTDRATSRTYALAKRHGDG
ncbi:hypothetical protein L3Q67_01080 [Saccharothrix sp. AJ9571]|nr:hypothetical protein L3Q67_01080 [Saccharothrix sp. AJ9571]